MTDTMIIEGMAFVGGLIAIVLPIVRLNGSVVKLTTVVDNLERLIKEKTDELDRRVSAHGREIDDLKLSNADHEARIKQLEK